MPTAFWIWDISRLECCMIVLQQQSVRQLLWHPCDPYTLAVTCGHEYVYLTERANHDEDHPQLKLGVVPVPAGKKKNSWSPALLPPPGNTIRKYIYNIPCFLSV